MDTHWFAVDKDGRVALFFTSECGFMPLSANSVEANELVALYRLLAGEDPPGVDEDDDIEDWDEFKEALGGQGLFDYNYIEGSGDPDRLLRPYTLWGVPENEGLHVDQLPPDWRERCRKCRLESVSFGDEQLQPLDQTTDQWFSYSEDSCAYLSADERTVRPVPGREDKYQEFYRDHADELKEKGWQVEEPGAP
jgi:hypothetical protein